MKTIDYIKQELQRLSCKEFGLCGCKKLGFYKNVLMYLETNPRIEFLQSEKARLEKIIEAKNSKYEYWIKNVVSHEVLEKDRRNLFNRETGITNCKRFLKSINYILSPIPQPKTIVEPIKTNKKNDTRRKNTKQNNRVTNKG